MKPFQGGAAYAGRQRAAFSTRCVPTAGALDSSRAGGEALQLQPPRMGLPPGTKWPPCWSLSSPFGAHPGPFHTELEGNTGTGGQDGQANCTSVQVTEWEPEKQNSLQ